MPPPRRAGRVRGARPLGLNTTLLTPLTAITGRRRCGLFSRGREPSIRTLREWAKPHMVSATKTDGLTFKVSELVAGVAKHLQDAALVAQFGVFFGNKNRKTKNALEADLVVKAKERTKNATDLALLQSTLASRAEAWVSRASWPWV